MGDAGHGVVFGAFAVGGSAGVQFRLFHLSGSGADYVPVAGVEGGCGGFYTDSGADPFHLSDCDGTAVGIPGGTAEATAGGEGGDRAGAGRGKRGDGAGGDAAVHFVADRKSIRL